MDVIQKDDPAIVKFEQVREELYTLLKPQYSCSITLGNYGTDNYATPTIFVSCTDPKPIEQDITNFSDKTGFPIHLSRFSMWGAFERGNKDVGYFYHSMFYNPVTKNNCIVKNT